MKIKIDSVYSSNNYHLIDMASASAANSANAATSVSATRSATRSINALNVFAPEYISPFTDMNTVGKHRKRWTDEDNTVLDQYVNNNEVITHLLVSEIAKKLERTHYAIKVRIMKNYVVPSYDYVDYDNEGLYNKYVCYGRDCIDNMVYFNYTKKDKILVKLDKMSRLIDVEHVTSQDELLDLIDQITDLL
jgi:hypothetical protein